MASTEPECAVSMVAQFIISIRMHEDVERAVIERKPAYDIGKLHRLKRDLVAPPRMGSDLSLVKATHLDPVAKLRSHRFAKYPGGIEHYGIELDMRMPARDARHIEIRHCRSFRSRASLQPFWLQFTLTTHDCRFVCRRSRAASAAKRLEPRADIRNQQFRLFHG